MENFPRPRRRRVWLETGCVWWDSQCLYECPTSVTAEEREKRDSGNLQQVTYSPNWTGQVERSEEIWKEGDTLKCRRRDRGGTVLWYKYSNKSSGHVPGHVPRARVVAVEKQCGKSVSGRRKTVFTSLDFGERRQGPRPCAGFSLKVESREGAKKNISSSAPAAKQWSIAVSEAPQSRIEGLRLQGGCKKLEVKGQFYMYTYSTIRSAASKGQDLASTHLVKDLQAGCTVADEN